jgi:hypothetical protein
VTDDASISGERLAPAFDTTVPQSARLWNYWLGGKDNFPTDRAAGDQIVEVFPDIVRIARSSRAFLSRAVRFLAGEVGNRQFLDVGTGLPTAENTHEIAQRVSPTSKIVYIDNDPMVLAHARALLVGTPEGATSYIDADVRDPEKIVTAATRFLDFTQPVTVMLLGILGHVTDDDLARAVVEHLVDAMPPGSHLTISDGTACVERVHAARVHDEAGGAPYRGRTPEQIADFFHGLDILAPGVVPTPFWRPEPGETPFFVAQHCGVARKP